MHYKKEQKQTMSLQVTEGLTVTILPDSNHEFLMTTKELANGYGSSEYVVRQNKSTNPIEFIEGKHFVKGVSIPHTLPNAQPHQIFWTKRGVVRLGFFIKSERAKLFRDWAEDLVLQKMETVSQGLTSSQALTAGKRKHNRLTQERLVSIMADVCRINDHQLRLSISNKLLSGGEHGTL